MSPDSRCGGGEFALRLPNKTAVITGAASGIGKATAELFAAEGARVMIGDIVDATAVVQSITDRGGVCDFRFTDVTVASDVQSLLEATMARWGQVDILFNNAGVSLPKPITDVSEEDFDRVFAVNVRGVYLGCRFAIPQMLAAGGGSIINMSSSGGLLARAGDPVYSASRHAVMGLTRALAVMYAARNVRVNALCPGPIDTPPLWDGAVTENDRAAKLAAILATCPAARYGQPTEVAQAALFLASDEAPFVNGVGLAVDGAKSAGIMPINRYRLDLSANM